MIMQEARPDRRTELRVSPKGAVIVRSDTYIMRGRVVNVSRSGLLATTTITAPERMLGSTVDIELRLDAGDASWLELRGRILRIAAGSLAIGLDAVPAAFTRIIDQTLTRSLQKSMPRTRAGARWPRAFARSGARLSKSPHLLKPSCVSAVRISSPI
jgi:hypothetical protein